MNHAYCPACRQVVPIVRQIIGKLIGAAIGGLFGLSNKTMAWGEKILCFTGSVFLGDLVDEGLGVVCGRCGSSIRKIELE